MLLTEYETRGYYEPGFLHLRVNVDICISNLNELLSQDRRIFSTFLHEYIHFLQDISSTHGLMSANLLIDRIKDINWDIRNDNSDTFPVPVYISNKNNTALNLELQKIYRGQSSGTGGQLVKYDRYTVEQEKLQDRDGNYIEPKRFRVYYYNLITRDYHGFYFGSVCLKEYVAHTIQKLFEPDVEHDDIPYQIAEQIAQQEYSVIASQPLYVAALCDAALMCLHPAEIFFEALQRMREDSFIPTTAESVYEFVNLNFTYKNELQALSTTALFDYIGNITKQQFSDALQAEVFATNLTWLHYLIDRARELRIKNPGFITQLVTGPGQLSPLFFQLVRELGTPYFTNRTEIGGFIPPQGLQAIPQQPYQLLVFKQVMAVFSGHKSCSMYKLCQQRPDEDITDENCKTAPWLRATYAQLCPFGQIWKTWGLTDEMPVARN